MGENSNIECVFEHPVFYKRHLDHVHIIALYGYYLGQFLELVRDVQDVLESRHGYDNGEMRQGGPGRFITSSSLPGTLESD